MKNRAQRRADVAYARELAKDPWSRLELKTLTALERAIPAKWGDFVDAYVNNILSVQVYRRATPWGKVAHLALRRHDGREIQGFDLLQRAKNEVAGDGAVAIEVYPAQHELVDNAPMRHLFVLPPDLDEAIPHWFTIRGDWS